MKSDKAHSRIKAQKEVTSKNPPPERLPAFHPRQRGTQRPDSHQSLQNLRGNGGWVVQPVHKITADAHVRTPYDNDRRGRRSHTRKTAGTDPGLLRKPLGQSLFFAITSPSARRGSAGAAMVEVVTALFIVTFGIFSVLTMYHVGMANTRAIREHDLVMSALQNELDGLRAAPSDCLPKDWNGDFRATKPNLPNLVNLRPHLRIRPFAEGRADLLEVTVSIRWTGEHGRLIEKSLTTLIAEKPARDIQHANETP